MSAKGDDPKSLQDLFIGAVVVPLRALAARTCQVFCWMSVPLEL